jgi:uncharacterized membrane protein HdeD (DUF308 family)
MSNQNAFGEVKSPSGWAIFMGLLTAALGVFLILYPVITATLTTIVLGWSLILVGIVQLAFAFQSRSIGQFFLRTVSCLLNGVIGIVLVAMPVQGVAALTGILGMLFVAQSVIQTIVAFRLRPVEGWGWVLFDSVWSLLLGVLILVQWPSSSVWAIGTLVGASVLVNGITRMMVAIAARGTATRVDRLVHGKA